jgi:hypothetical protein
MDWCHDAEWTQGIRTAELTREADAGSSVWAPRSPVRRPSSASTSTTSCVWPRTNRPRLLGMISVAGPMPMYVIYAFEPDACGTLARIRVRGGEGGFHRLAAPPPGPVLADHRPLVPGSPGS